MTTSIKSGMYQVRLKWTTKDDETEVGYTNVTVKNWAELQTEIATAKKYVAHTAKDKNAVEATFKLIRLVDATYSYHEDDDYLNLNDNSDINFILGI